MSESRTIRERMYPEVAAGGFSRVDGTISFYSRVQALLPTEGVVIDYGAGRGAAHHDDPVEYRRRLRDLRGPGRRVVAVDVDDAVIANPSADEALVCDGTTIGLPDSSAGLILSDMTFEHIDQPRAVVSEFSRVLGPGGWVCIRTPNRYGYIGLGARIVPNRLHTRALSVLQPDRREHDVFPTRYRANTRRTLLDLFSAQDWDERVWHTWDAEPAYFGSSLAGWRLMALVHRLTPQSLGSMIMFFARRSEG